MAVVIRMKRTGRRNAPCYRISVADSRFPRDGRTLETIGVYDPASPVVDLRAKLDVERAKHWISVGAKPSETVHSLFKTFGVYGETPPAPKKRSRPGRKKVTKSGQAHRAAKAARAERKDARRTERIQVRREAAKAAKAAAAAESAEE